MHKTKQCTIIILILSATILPSIPHVHSQEPAWYEPTDITILDNAYNKTSYFSLQWWYLDTMFTNNYSIHVGILSIGTQGKFGFFLLRISLYQNTEIIAREHRIVPLRHMQFSPAEPQLNLQGKELLKTYYDTNDHLCLFLNISIKNIGVNLTFTGETQGWKGYTGHGMWGCPLPKATVSGTLHIDDTVIPVEGTGYQERGWDVRRFHKSWFWGKLTSANHSIIFSQNMKNRWNEDFFLVMINLGTDRYVSIHRENIMLIHSEYVYSHGKRIPIDSMFEIHEEGIDVVVRLSAQAIDFHRLSILRYWRFHMQVTGTISCEAQTEEVDEVQIMEFCHFL